MGGVCLHTIIFGYFTTRMSMCKYFTLCKEFYCEFLSSVKFSKINLVGKTVIVFI